MLSLLLPSVEYRVEFFDYLADYRRAGEMDRELAVAAQDFEAYIARLIVYSHGRCLPPGWVPMTTYWLVDENRMILGEGDLRHRLNPDLQIVGGHIGYRIRPSARRKGYGTHLLALMLERARAMGLKRVLLTCDEDNSGSSRIMQKNGGIQTKRFFYPPTGKNKLHYWFDLENP